MMDLDNEMKLLRPIKAVKATKAKYCAWCPNAWEVGADIFIINQPFDVLCFSCGTNFMSLRDRAAGEKARGLGQEPKKVNSFLSQEVNQNSVLEKILERLADIEKRLNDT